MVSEWPYCLGGVGEGEGTGGADCGVCPEGLGEDGELASLVGGWGRTALGVGLELEVRSGEEGLTPWEVGEVGHIFLSRRHLWRCHVVVGLSKVEMESWCERGSL